MAYKSTKATSFEQLGPDGTGTIFFVRYTCPHCNSDVNDMVYTSRNDVNIPFETDKKCKICNEYVTIICEEDKLTRVTTKK